MVVTQTNSFEVTRLEGLYIEERTPPAAVQGIDLNDVGVTGLTVRGPVGRVVEITSPQRFLDVFGGRTQASGTALANNVWLSMVNKKFGAVYVARVAAAAAVTATLTLKDAGLVNVLRVDASSPGVWGNDVTVQVTAATDSNANHVDLIIAYNGQSVTYRNIDIHTAGADNTLQVVGTDDANWIVLTKLTSGIPAVLAATPLATGADGSVADSDYTATGKGMNLLQAQPGLIVMWVAEHSSATIRAYAHTLAATDLTRFWILDEDDETKQKSDVVTDVATYRGKNEIYAWNPPYTIDPQVGAEVVTHPASWMACLFSQTNANIHVGDPDNESLLAGITKLQYQGLVRQDYIDLKNAGVCALEKTEDGFGFVSGVVTYLPDGTGQEQIADRRERTFLELSPARVLAKQVKKPKTLSRKVSIKGILTSFLGDLQKAEFIVDQDRAGTGTGTGPGFLVDITKLNSVIGEQQGLFKVSMKVRRMGHILYLDVVSEIGTLVTTSVS
jgi:hypothetical protein